ncbi:MAG: GtrA family protein [Hyphomicrobiaceae bacterium]
MSARAGHDGGSAVGVGSRRVASAIRTALGKFATWLEAFVLAPGRFAELVRYTMVSATALIVDLATFAALMASGPLTASSAGAFSVLTGLVVHYLLSTRFVFDAAATGKSHGRLVGEYAMTGLLGFVVTWIAIAVVVDVLGMPAGVGKLSGVGATFITVYLVRAGLVFRRAPLATARPPIAG